MKKKIVFVHSAGPQGPHEGSHDLVDYLRKSLGAKYDIEYPTMPDPDRPDYKKWKTKLEKILGAQKGDLILIGHSLGGLVLLKFLSEKEFKKNIAGLFLVELPYWGKKDWEIEEFVLHQDFETKLPSIQKIFLYHSSGDEWVPFSHLDDYTKKFPDAVVRRLGGDEHGFGSGLPVLAEDIMQV
jgi:uncharacterized protein